MVNLLALDFGDHLLFFLVLLRISGVFFFAPIFGSNNVPPTVLILISVLISLLMFDLIPPASIDFSQATWSMFTLICVKEFFLGFLLGLIPQIIFSAVELAGSIIGNMMGVSIVNLVDPQSDTQVSLIGSFKNTIALMLFLVLDGHHLVVEALFESFRQLPLGGIEVKASFLPQFIKYSSLLFVLGIKISAPLMILMLFTNLIMGFMARSIPNLNIFLIGFPISITIGMIALAFTLPSLVIFLSGLIEQSGKDMLLLIKSLAP